jgi:hypothetical protein
MAFGLFICNTVFATTFSILLTCEIYSDLNLVVSMTTEHDKYYIADDICGSEYQSIYMQSTYSIGIANFADLR